MRSRRLPVLAKCATRAVPADPAELVRYVTDEQKLGWLHVENFTLADSRDDLDLAVAEMKVTQSLNTRTRQDKTYHLIASFGPDDRPSPGQMMNVQRHLAESIGMGSHQRITALHTNTANWHLHILINKICRFTRRCIAPFVDYFRLSRACRELELKHGFQRDPGMHHIEGREVVISDRLGLSQAQVAPAPAAAPKPVLTLTAGQANKVQAIVEQIAGDAGRYFPVKNIGQYRGELVARIGRLGIQRLGVNTFAVHDTRRLERSVRVGQSVQVDYRGGRGQVQGYDQVQHLARNHEHGRGRGR